MNSFSVGSPFPMFAADCGRCGLKMATFDVLGGTAVAGSHGEFELACACRACGGVATASVLQTRNYGTGLFNWSGMFINEAFQFMKWVFNIPAVKPCPGHVPDEIRGIFIEATTCEALGLHDAAGTMFRKVLDAATRTLVDTPESGAANEVPNWKTYKDLRLRLDFLFARGLLPRSLEDLASCIHQDGNEAAHSVEGIGAEEAADLSDFAETVLEELYTRPGQIAENQRRRAARRGGL